MTPGALSETDLATLLGLVCRAHRLALWHWTLPEQSIRVFSECAELDFGKATQWNEILDHPDHALMMAAFQRAHASGFDQFSVTCKACPEKGTGVPVSLRGKIAEYDAKGYPASIVGMMQATAPTAGPVQSGEEKKGEASGNRTRFLANMSHEVRTPLNGILGMVELALDTRPNPEQKELLLKIRSSSTALLRILNDILDFSKAAAGKYSFQTTLFSMRNLVCDVLSLFASDACNKRLDFCCNLDPALPDALYGDEGRIRQVLTNLVGNAIKFTPEGEVCLDASWQTLDDDSILLKCAVRDTGIGIDATQAARIFEPFVQADNSRSRIFGGTGLGLSISRELARGMGGTLSVESTPGRGATFHLDLPLKLAGNATERLPAERPVRHRILLSTPLQGTARSIAGYLKAAGHDLMVTDSTADTEKALAAAESENRPFDAWFLDADLATADQIESSKLRAPGVSAGLSRCILMSNVLRFSTDTPLCDRLGIPARLCKPAIDRDVARAMLEALAPSPPGDFDTTLEIAIDEALIEAGLRAPTDRWKLLVVDDDQINLQVMTKTLERLGHSVSTATNGQEALACFENEGFDVIIMDIQMPLMDGLAATEAIRLKELRRSWVTIPSNIHTPIIGLTADIQASVHRAALDAGMNEILSKPITRAELTAALARVIQPSC